MYSIKQTKTLKTTIKLIQTNYKTSLTLASALVLALSLLAYANLTTTNTNTAHAVTPPDSCFYFNVATNTITDYYDNENNDSGQPACPKDVDIPSTIAGTPVTTIDDHAFAANQLTTLTIPSSVTTIGGNAFYSNQLTTLTIPSSVTTIGYGAFAANQLTTVTIDGNNITPLGSGVFFYNPITSFTYNGTTYTTADPLTDDCYQFDSGIGTITRFLFADISTIQNHNNACLNRTANIPSTIGGIPVTTISGNAFQYNQLTTLTIPSSVITIGHNAFAANQLTTLTIPSSVTTISSSAFAYNQLTTLTIPSSVTTISSSAFAANQLTTVTIDGNNITSSGSDVFIFNPITSFTYNGTTYTTADPLTDDCYQFNSVTGTITDFLSADIATIRDHNNACLNKTVNIPSTIGGTQVTTIGDYAFRYNQLTTLTIPSSVTTIGDYAFAANQLTTVTIPNSVTSAGAGVFVMQTVPGGTSSIDLYVTYTGSGFDPVVAQSFIESVIYTNIYIDPAQATTLGLADAVMTEADMGGTDLNSDGDTTDALGAQLINPAHLNLAYQDTDGNNLTPPSGTPTTMTGNGLTTYLAVDNPTNDFSLYYHSGDTVPLSTPPTITGYELVGTPPTTTTLANAGENNLTYIYQVLEDSTGGDSSNSGSNDNDTGANNPNNQQGGGTDKLNNTGQNIILATVAATAIVSITIVLLLISRKRSIHFIHK